MVQKSFVCLFVFSKYYFNFFHNVFGLAFPDLFLPFESHCDHTKRSEKIFYSPPGDLICWAVQLQFQFCGNGKCDFLQMNICRLISLHFQEEYLILKQKLVSKPTLKYPVAKFTFSYFALTNNNNNNNNLYFNIYAFYTA